MDSFFLILVMAVTIEALIEYAKSLFKMVSGEGMKATITQLVAIVLASVLCVLAGADLYRMLGVQFSAPVIGSVLTGIICSRGANYVSDILKRLQVDSLFT